MRIKIADNEEVLNARDIWTNLVKTMKIPTVFLTWEWVTIWMKHFGHYYKPLILFIYDGIELVAILPLMQRNMRLPGGIFRVRALSISGSMELYPNHLDIICAESNANRYVTMVFEFLRSEFTDWDILHFAFLSDQGHLASYLKSYMHEKRGVRLTGTTAAPFITTQKKLSDFLRTFNRKKRYNLNREKKILFQTNNVTVHRLEKKDDLHAGLDALFKLHKERADEKKIASTFEAEEILRFHRNIAQKFLDRGWLRLCLLKKDDNVISAVYGFKFERKFDFYQTGLDPAWKRFSAGKILIYEILEEVFHDDIDEFDFLGGDEDYKTFWTKECRNDLTFSLYNKSLRAYTENWFHSIKNIAKSVLREKAVH